MEPIRRSVYYLLYYILYSKTNSFFYRNVRRDKRKPKQ